MITIDWLIDWLIGLKAIMSIGRKDSVEMRRYVSYFFLENFKLHCLNVSSTEHTPCACTLCELHTYCAAGVDKPVRSTSLYHCRQCSILLKPCSDRIDYTPSFALWRTTAAESQGNGTSASWVWFKFSFCISVQASQRLNSTKALDSQVPASLKIR